MDAAATLFLGVSDTGLTASGRGVPEMMADATSAMLDRLVSARRGGANNPVDGGADVTEPIRPSGSSGRWTDCGVEDDEQLQTCNTDDDDEETGY